MDQDLDNWYLPYEMSCGTDLTTRPTLSNKTVINIIVHQILGSKIPNITYITGSAEWANGTRSGVLYIPRDEVTFNWLSIPIEVQNQVDQCFMLKLISYCASVYNRYEVLPVVLILVVDKFCNAQFEERFVEQADLPYILETQCEHFGKFYFTTSQAQNLESLTFTADLTVLDQASSKAQEIIELQDEDPILALKKSQRVTRNCCRPEKKVR